MDKKLITGFLVIYVALSLTNFLLHGVINRSEYMPLVEQGLMRGEDAGMMWIHFVTSLFTAFFFTLIFSKGYRGTGIAEGVRFGFYAGMFVIVQAAYDSYAVWPMPYMVALKWFIGGIIQYVILGVLVAAVYGKKADAA